MEALYLGATIQHRGLVNIVILIVTKLFFFQLLMHISQENHLNVQLKEIELNLLLNKMKLNLALALEKQIIVIYL